MILAKRSEGKSTRQIADEVGVDHKTVCNVMNRTGENSPVDQPETITGKDGKVRKSRAHRSKKPELDAAIKEGLADGKSTQTIRKELGVTNATVERRVQNMAIVELEAEVDRLRTATVTDEAQHSVITP